MMHLLARSGKSQGISGRRELKVAWRRDKSEKKIKGEGWGEKENDN
jgi:hypothetical protein